ncbi:Nif11-like leader peptide family natural product precursor [Prosthecochloris sp. HL-130-GSB]|jgi:hypothetical protein|uniref:Nif11-like leader peptide family natural product precursor n=1 Tax=Prosthecochloris sp. HL-130-GSB TaxID=1974213 RepID=UPI001B19E5EA|nr:Nif11-like leader peptide family natural product precursor [Prosthecochloris sp. HL-130-GSB]MBO8092390.1 hypothetical protein [Prosthecochloris sp.]
MTIAQSKLLYEKLNNDEQFRDCMLAAGSMLECMSIIERHGFDCSMYELRMTVEKYMIENNLGRGDGFRSND